MKKNNAAHIKTQNIPISPQILYHLYKKPRKTNFKNLAISLHSVYCKMLSCKKSRKFRAAPDVSSFWPKFA